MCSSDLWDSSAITEARSAGVVAARRLYATMLQACGLAVPAAAPPPVVATDCELETPTFTVAAEPSHEALVSRDLSRIVRGVREAVPDCEAIALLGSFGRGEGVVRDEPQLRAINDYDLFVIGGTHSAGWDTLRASLRRDCHVDDVDLGSAPGGFEMHPCQDRKSTRLNSSHT